MDAQSKQTNQKINEIYQERMAKVCPRKTYVRLSTKDSLKRQVPTKDQKFMQFPGCGIINTLLSLTGFVMMFPVMLPINTLSFLHYCFYRYIWQRDHFMKHSTMNLNTVATWLLNHGGICNCITISTPLNRDRFYYVLKNYLKRNNFVLGGDIQVDFQTRRDENCCVDSIYKEAQERHYNKRYKSQIIVIVTESQTYYTSLNSFTHFDGTSVFNFHGQLIEAYFNKNDEVRFNRPTLTFSKQKQQSFSLWEIFKCTMIETVMVSRTIGAAVFRKDFYGLFFPSLVPVSCKCSVMKPECTKNIIEEMKTDREKPFAKFLSAIGEALEPYYSSNWVLLLTQISAQWRYYLPIMPRDQVGYWLINSAKRFCTKKIGKLQYAEEYYHDLIHDIDNLDGAVRYGLLRQGLLGVGGMAAIGLTHNMIWFNNYGLRTINIPDGIEVSYNWGANKTFNVFAFVNIISVNGKISTTLSSKVLNDDQLQEVSHTFFNRIYGVDIGVAKGLSNITSANHQTEI